MWSACSLQPHPLLQLRPRVECGWLLYVPGTWSVLVSLHLWRFCYWAAPTLPPSHLWWGKRRSSSWYSPIPPTCSARMGRHETQYHSLQDIYIFWCLHTCASIHTYFHFDSAMFQVAERVDFKVAPCCMHLEGCDTQDSKDRTADHVDGNYY